MTMQRQWLPRLVLLLLTLKVGTAQNFPPVFPEVLGSVTVPELQEEDADFEIYDANATDPDGDEVTYVIPANSLNSQWFRVEGDTGKVFTRPGVVLDREELSPDNDPLDLFIEAQDDLHDEYVRFQLIIILQDVNDNHPTIDPNFPSSISYPEDTSPSTVLLTVEATDDDSGANAFIYYSLLEPSVMSMC
jgi:hypothetical protein